MAQAPNRSLADKLMGISKPWIFATLIVVTTVPLFFGGIKVPNKPEQSTMDFYAALNQVPAGKTVLIDSDWTNSTRGESGGQFEALVRILMRRKVKMAFFTLADPQAPQVVRDTITRLNVEAAADQAKGVANAPAPLRPWEDYVMLGYFPNAEGTSVTIGSSLRKAFGSKTDVDPSGTPRNVFESPVLKDYKMIGDVPLLIVVTASNTSNVVIERLSNKARLAMMVTGVMGPETQVYYSSGQLVGLSKGLKGVYDLETMMNVGINYPTYETAQIKFDKDRTPYPPFTGLTNLDKGSKYYPTLHFALTLLIIMVVIGNVGMVLGKKRAA